MAVDSVAKRFSMLAFARGPHIPIPDGTIGQADRQHFLWLYGGILLTGAGVGPPYSVEAGEVFLAGAITAEAFLAGAATGQAFIAGAVAGETG